MFRRQGPRVLATVLVLLSLGQSACDADEDPDPAATESTSTTGPDWSTGSGTGTTAGSSSTATSFDPSESGAGTGSTGSSTTGPDLTTSTTTASSGTSSGSSTTGMGTGTGSESGSTESSGGSTDTTGPELCEGAFACVVGAPEGWMGPVALASSEDADAQPGCGDAWSQLSGALTYAELAFEPVECRSCSCGPVEDIECGSVEAEFYRGSSCSGSGAGSAAIDSAESCVSLELSASSSTSVELSPLGLADGANCKPSGKKITDRPDSSWGHVAQACAAEPVDLGMCEEGSSCFPVVDADLDTSLCIYAEGEQACPEDGPYSQRSVRYIDSKDERDCAECSCGAPEGDLACEGNLVLYAADNCGTSGDSKGVAKLDDTQCVTLSFPNDQAPASARIGRATPTGSGSCAAAGGEAIGEVVGTGAVTFCCAE